MTNLTLFDYNSNTVRFRSDGWGSLTDMAKATGKLVADWTRLKSANEYLEALSLAMGIPIANLTELERGGKGYLDTTWAHPKVCIRFAQWCNPQFAVWVDFKIDELIRTGSTQLKDASPKPAISYYTDRVLHMRKHLVAPKGYWCVVQKSAHLLLEVEKAGYPIGEYDLLDGSIGLCWSNYRKGKEWMIEDRQALYVAPCGKEIVIKAYHLDELKHFTMWLDGEYEGMRMLPYLVRKYGELALAC